VTLDEAVAADRRGDLQAAADGYEAALAAGPRPLALLVDLAVLYWQATDPGLAAARQLGPDFLARAGARVPELLAEAARRFPARSEPRFWLCYVAWADLGEPFERDVCRAFLREDPGTLVPALYLYSTSGGSDAEASARALLEACRQEGTTRARYVVSVIEGVLARRARRPPG
jgi:hypothetical protein